MLWSYGITTVPQRRVTTLSATVRSLAAAGFENPHLFIDGAESSHLWNTQFPGLSGVTCRSPTVRTAGNWVLSLYELYYRVPNADRYAVFQDDFVTYRGLREYLERCQYPDGSGKAQKVYGAETARGYLNLYTFPQNQALCPRLAEPHGNLQKEGWYLSNQLGKGAVALVFNRDAVIVLLHSRHLAFRPLDVNRGHWAIDGGVVQALKDTPSTHELGGPWYEFVHNPSLVQHIGHPSTLDKGEQPDSLSFRGEGFDVRSLLP